MKKAVAFFIKQVAAPGADVFIVTYDH
jgi:hypothetical protein